MATVRTEGPARLGGPARISIAGAEANVAIGLARLGHTCRWIGAVGDDQFGALVLRTLRAEGVDVSAVRIDAAPTGILVSEHRLAGVTRVDYHRRGSAGSTLAPDDLRTAWDPPPRFVHVTGLTMALGSGPAQAVGAAVRTAHERGVPVCLDVNHRNRLWTTAHARTSLQTLAGLLDVVIASDDELALLAPAGAPREDQVAALLEGGVSQIVLKHGAAGASAHTADMTVELPATPVTAVDPIGAGDAFVAGFLSGQLDGLPLADRLVRATTAGAFAAATIGDWEGLPHREELGLLGLQAGTVVR